MGGGERVENGRGGLEKMAEREGVGEGGMGRTGQRWRDGTGREPGAGAECQRLWREAKKRT